MWASAKDSDVTSGRSMGSTGIDEATRAQVSEPFFTTKNVGSGTGLGLSVALGIAEDHGGFIDAREISRV